MKNKEILQLYNALQDVSNLSGVKFAYAVSRNINKVKPTLNSLEEAINPKEEYKEFESKRVELAKKYAKKNENGEPVTNTDLDNNTKTYEIENQKAFQKEMTKLQKEYAQAITNREKQIEEYKNLLEEETQIDFYKIKKENLPEDITAQQLTGIFAIIEDEN